MNYGRSLLADLRGLTAVTLAMHALVANAQLSVSPQADLQQLAETITGDGVLIQNPVMTCHQDGFGEFTYGGGPLGINEGIILTSGTIGNAVGPNDVENKSFQQFTSGSTILDIVTGRTTRDACMFEFDIIPGGDSLTFDFVFASEEYNEWVGSQYNDVFGFFISGPGIAGDPGIGNDHNIALVPGTNQAITINNINNGSNSAFYHDNAGGSQVQYDGFTQGLQALAVVQPCQTYHLKLIVADASDRKWDSGVFIERIQSNAVTMTTGNAAGLPDLVEGCNPGWVRFTRQTVTATPLDVQFFIGGTATNGTDFPLVGTDPDPMVPKVATIPANQAFVDVPLEPIADGIAEGTETIQVYLGNLLCPGFVLDSLEVLVRDSLDASVPPGSTICAGGTTSLTATGGDSYSWSPSAGLNDASAASVQATPSATTTYQVTVSAGACSRVLSTTVTVSDIQLTGNVTAPLCSGGGNGAIDLNVSGGIPPYQYSWTGPGGYTASSEDVVNIGAGTYSVLVTDANGCNRTRSFNVNLPAPLAVTLTPVILPFGQHISCHGGSDGAIDLAMSGGTIPYSFQWSGPNGYTNTAEDLSGLAAGTYQVTVTDANGCSTSGDLTLVEPPMLTAQVQSVQDVSCHGAADGEASVSIAGGIPPYSVSWNTTPPQTGTSATGLPAGSYSASITDGYGCSTLVNASIVEPSLPLDMVVTSNVPVLCYEDSSGSVTVQATGGTAPYVYAWNTVPPQTGPLATDLPVGAHTVSISDANGCSFSGTVQVEGVASELFAYVESFSNATCFGASDGTATLDVSGGSGSYTIVWNTTPPQMGATASGLAPGMYTATVSDDNGCDTPKEVPLTITGPASPLAINLSVSDHNGFPISCAGAEDGAVDLTISGGQSPYYWQWSDTLGNQTGIEDLADLGPGLYTLTLSDANGCALDTTLSLDEPPALSATASVVPANCQGAADGAIDLSISGGIAPVGVQWSGPAGFTATTEDLSGLVAGIYSATLTDANGCTLIVPVNVTQPGLFSISATISDHNGFAVSCSGGSDGAVDANVSGGTPPYQFNWSGPGGFSAGQEDISALTAGTYVLSVSDANGCSSQASFTLEAPPVLDWTTQVSEVSCPGSTDGSIEITLSGGVPAYLTAWTGPNGFLSSSEDINALMQGNYVLLVTDMNGCERSDTMMVLSPDSLQLSASTTDHGNGAQVSCAGANDGGIDLAVTGGNGPYSFLWSNGQGYGSTDEDLAGLGAGDYDVLVTDANGCQATLSVPITAPAPLTVNGLVSVMNGSNVSCAGGSDGSIDLTIAGGTGPYSTTWSHGPTTEDLAGLSAGSYDVDVLDANGCSATASFSLTAPDVLESDMAPSQFPGGSAVSCTGASDGSIDLTVSGGTAPMMISWSGPGGFSANTEDIDDLGAGAYTATVTDANGCVLTSTVTLTGPAPLQAQLLVPSVGGGYDVACAGDSTASVQAVVSGGTPGYQLSWTGPDGAMGTGTSITGLPVGTYSLQVTDTLGCTTDASVSIDGPLALSGIILTSDDGFGNQVSCSGGDGSIDLQVQGGVPGYSFDWNGPAGFASATEDLNGLNAGSYTLGVTDANGCTWDTAVVLNAPNALGTSVSVTPNPCPGALDGAIDLNVQGGVGPFTYSWNGPGISGLDQQDLNGLASGSYSVVVTDAAGCTTITDVSVSGPQDLLANAYVSFYGSHNLQCAGDSSGVIELAPSGGTAPYAVTTVAPGGNMLAGLQLDSLVAGNYLVQITDANGCVTDTSITLTAPSDGLDVQLAAGVYPSGTNISCHGASDGWIDATVLGGIGPYQFAWRGPDSLEFFTEDIYGLPAGNYAYELVVVDSNQCTFSTQITLTQPDTMLMGSVLISDHPGGHGVSCAESTDGAIDLSITGGNGGYQVSWTGPGGFGSTDSILNGLAAGTYTYSVTDTNGCELIADVTLSAPDPLAVVIDPDLHPGGTAISCAGSGDGSITATIAGGTAGYTWAWSGPGVPPASPLGLSALGAGTYCLQVTDTNNCITQTCIELVEPQPLDLSTTINEAACGQNIGTIDLTVMGGTGPFAPLWSTGATSEDLSGLAPGSYQVLVSDANGCLDSLTAFVTGTPGVELIADVTGSLCNDGNDGAIDLSITSGSAPFVMVWSNGSSDEDLSGLTAGWYDVSVTDANGCTAALEAEVTEPAPLDVDTTVFRYANGYAISTAGASDGNVQVSVSGGSAPYTFAWSNGATGQFQSGLPSGTYTITITDANGCIRVVTVVLDEPDVLDLPTGFTPNGDGANDVYFIRGLDGFPRNTFLVVNRWGGTVFETINYRNDWAGTNMNGEPLPNGTYFVLLTVADGTIKEQRYVDLRR